MFLAGCFASLTSFSEISVLHHFQDEGSQPLGELIQGTDGYLYGTARDGGKDGYGTVYRLKPDGRDFQLVFTFDSGLAAQRVQNPVGRLLEASDGWLYGLTEGRPGGVETTLFRVRKLGTGFQVLGTPGFSLRSGLIEGMDGWLYGTHLDGVYRVRKDGSGLTSVQTFATAGIAGRNPTGWLHQDQTGKLFGTAVEDPSGNRIGVTFRLSPDGSGFSELHRFSSSQPENGLAPIGALVEDGNGFLYGVTFLGGEAGYGVVFRHQKDGTQFGVLHHFQRAEGAVPLGSLSLGKDGWLYGTTSAGGHDDLGTLYRLLPSGSGYDSFHHFSGGDGQAPVSALLQTCEGSWFGTTAGGGRFASSLIAGTMFQLAPDGSAFTNVHSFAGRDGVHSSAELTEGSDGILYGVSEAGGNAGSVYRLAKDGTRFEVLALLEGTTGQGPAQPLTDGGNGWLYGTTVQGGTTGAGVVFRLRVDGEQLQVLHTFAGDAFSAPEGRHPSSPLLLATDGFLYGLTSVGGTGYENTCFCGGGTLYRLRTDGTDFAVVVNFSAAGQGPSNPSGKLIEASDGALYGTTQSGALEDSPGGSLFRVHRDGSGFTTVRKWPGLLLGQPPNSEGAYLESGIIEGSDGFLYGTTRDGGSQHVEAGGLMPSTGTVFRVAKDGSDFTILHRFYREIGSSTNPDGWEIHAGLTQGLDGKLYGTARNGGIHGGGTLFRLGRDGAGFEVLHHFDRLNGSEPFARLIQGSDGAWYGSSRHGGRSILQRDPLGYGVVFRWGASTLNAAPIAEGDTAWLGAGPSTKISIPELLANDTDLENQIIAFHSLDLESQSGASIRRDGDWILYESPLGATTPDCFHYSIRDSLGGIGRGTVYVNRRVPSNEPSQNVVSIEASSTEIRLRFVAIPRRAIAVERSLGLQPPIQWTRLGIAIADGKGRVDFVDSEPPPEAAFYRTVDP